MRLKFWKRKHDVGVDPLALKVARQEATALSFKNVELLKRDCELSEREAEAARRFKARRQSNGFIEMIEEIILQDKR